ncbi:MAG: hypothetical protein K9N21_18565 [Deltaproteobacteria bacterium]|nr:hypothetical protein [Deltaproteobacteria bacterium]
MTPLHKNAKIALICALVTGILILHYVTLHEKTVQHALYRMLFYMPLVLGSFWFGFKGALYISMAVAVFYLPYAIFRWQGFAQDFDKVLEGSLYIFIALILGFLAERERKEHTKRVESERLAAIGKAVSEIAHDMKSPLMAIGGFTTQVSRKLSADDPKRKKLDLVVKETSRLESMVREMLDFSRAVQLQISMESLNRLAEDCVEMCRPIGEAHNVELKTAFDPDLPPQPLDRNRMEQVMMNLITNAVQASAPQQAVWIRTHKAANNAVLECCDTGYGINEKDLDKIFEPFFSTKKDGTGLGLPIVKKIVEAHGGSISLRPNPDAGVTFSVRLPLKE